MHIGVAGVGNWGKNLVRTFHRLGALAAVFDLDPESRKTIKEQYPDVTVYDDFAALIASDVHGVAIATPAHTHYLLAREALLAGKDVFVEKPMTLTRSEGVNLVNIAEREKRIIMAGHLLLYQPAIQWIKQFIETGAIGNVKFLTQERLKLGRVRSVENVLWSFGVHDIAVFLYLLGEKSLKASAIGQCALQDGIEDDVYLHITFPDGVRAHLHVSWLWPEMRRCLTIVGSEAMLVYDELEQKVTLYKKRIDSSLRSIDEGAEVVFQGNGEPLLLECRHFLECIEERKKPLSDGYTALDVIEILENASVDLRRVEDGQ